MIQVLNYFNVLLRYSITIIIFQKHVREEPFLRCVNPFLLTNCTILCVINGLIIIVNNTLIIII